MIATSFSFAFLLRFLLRGGGAWWSRSSSREVRIRWDPLFL